MAASCSRAPEPVFNDGDSEVMPYMSLFLAAKSFVLERDVPDNAGATGGLAQGDSRPVKRDADADAAEGSGNSAGSGVTNLDDGMSAARFYVPSLPGLPADSALTLYAGHIPSNPVVDGVLDTTSDAHLFFLLVKNRHIADADRTVIWFNGGPGCSSFDGSLMEVGPFRLVPNGDGQLKEIDGAWNEYANVLFVDQPAGTGYSYINTNSYIHELPLMGAHVGSFLKRFYDVFPEFASHDTYLAGESYAGQYIPYIADTILKSADLPNNLKGLLIGNGWIDPLNQYPAYLDFALEAGIVKKDSPIYGTIAHSVDSCNKTLTAKGVENIKVHNGGTCEAILSQITDSTIQNVNGQKMCVNNYDIRLTDKFPSCGAAWPPDLPDMYKFLNKPEVIKAFHATRKQEAWVECSGQVGSQFWARKSAPAVTLLPSLLEKVPILLFAGDQDLICCYKGIEALSNKLTWNGDTGFGDVEAEEWVVDGKAAGTWRTARNLTYVRMFEASHMAPYDKPIVAHDMLLRFMGVNLLGAAGPAARVPSKVGTEQEAVLGHTLPNGTVATGDGTSLSSSSGASELGSDSTIEAVVNAGSAIVIVALMLVAALIVLVVRRRVRRSGGNDGSSSIPLPTVRSRRSHGGDYARVSQEMEGLVDGEEYSGDDRRDHKRSSLPEHEVIFRLDDEHADERRRSDSSRERV